MFHSYSVKCDRAASGSAKLHQVCSEVVIKNYLKWRTTYGRQVEDWRHSHRWTPARQKSRHPNLRMSKPTRCCPRFRMIPLIVLDALPPVSSERNSEYRESVTASPTRGTLPWHVLQRALDCQDNRAHYCHWCYCSNCSNILLD